MMRFKRRSFGSGQRLEQHHEDAPMLDLSRDTSENMRELLTEITKKDHISTAKRMGFLNNFSHLVRSVPPTANFGFSPDEVAACLRVSLINPAKEVRAASFRAFRYLLADEDSYNVFLNQRIDIFIVKSLDLPPVAEVERVQALRLVRKMVYLCPHLFPMSLAMVLSSISSNVASSEKDCMSAACLATLCELAIQNIMIGSYSGVIGAIISSTLDCSLPRMNESLISTVLYLFNNPKYRCYVRRKVGLEGVLAPLTDLYYMYTCDLKDNLIKEDRLNRMGSARLALVTILKSWAGLIMFCDPEGKNLNTLLGIFQLPNSDIRRTIIDTLYDVFCLRRPKETEDFVVMLESVDPSSMQDNWKLTELFLLAEADAVLPHRAKSSRMSMVENYVSLILYAFFQVGILESLVHVIMTSEEVICMRGAILLGELLHMANLLLPPTISSHTHCLPSLMALATNLEKTPMERGKAGVAAGYLDQVHQMKKRGIVPNTLFMEQLIEQSERSERLEKDKRKIWRRFDKIDPQFTWRDMDEVLNGINKTQVMSTTEKDYELWNWDIIKTILTSPKMSIKRPDEPISYRFVKRLVMFYKPSNLVYALVKQTSKLARKYSECVLQLTDFLMQKEEQPEGEQLLIEILQDLSLCLGEAAQPGPLSNILSTPSLSETLSRDYFLIIGRLSATQDGLRILDKTPGIFQYLMEICSMTSRDSLIKVIISCFDYGKDGIARILLSKALTSAPLSARLYATKFLRVLLRIKSQFFNNWGIEFLTNQLYDCEAEVVEATISILEEACEDEANLHSLIEVKPSLLHLGEQGIRLLSRYASITYGFSYLEDVSYLSILVDAWKTNYNREYVTWIELEIMESLSSYDRSCADGGYMNRSHTINYELKEIYSLPHLYGELARHRYGIKLINEQGLLNDAVKIVMAGNTETMFDISQLKAGLWAIGHIGSTVPGINLILSQYTSSRMNHFSQTSDMYADENTNELSTGYQGFNGAVEDYHDVSGGGGEELEDTIVEQEELDYEVMEEEDEEDELDIISHIVNLAYQCEVLTIRGTCFFVLSLMARTSAGADKLEELGWECVRHKGSDMWPVQYDNIQPVYYDSDPSDPEVEDCDVDDANIALFEQLNSEEIANSKLYGGVYCGDDDAFDQDVPLDLRYVVHKWEGNKKGAGKEAKLGDKKGDEVDAISTMVHGNQCLEENKGMKCKYTEVNQYGVAIERPQESLISAMESEFMESRDHSLYGMLPESLASTQISENKPPEYSFIDAFPFISGTVSDLPPLPVEDLRPGLTKTDVFDDAGIYLGSEFIDDLLFSDDLQDDSIEANIQALIPPSPPPPYYLHDASRTFENNEPLKPISEEKSQENLDMVKPLQEEEKYTENIELMTNTDLIGISVVKEIQVEVLKGKDVQSDSNQENDENSDHNNSIFDTGNCNSNRESNDGGDDATLYMLSGSVQNSVASSSAASTSGASTSGASNAEAGPAAVSCSSSTSSTSTSTTVANGENERFRSVSFTDGAGRRTEIIPTSPRSFSFSGMPMHSKNSARTQAHPRSDSDPGVVPNSLASSLSSQDSDLLRNGPSASLVPSKKVNKSSGRKKSRSENETDDRNRSLSLMSDNSSHGGMRTNKSTGKRIRGGSALNITGTSPKSLRNYPSFSDSVSPYCRGHNPSYSVWQTLRKQRSFRNVPESSISCGGSFDRRRVNKSYGYRRGRDAGKGSGSRSGKSISSSGTCEVPTNDLIQHCPTTEVYVGRCLPGRLPDFFTVEPYSYLGSWADNFNDPSDILESLNTKYRHCKDRCLVCRIEPSSDQNTSHPNCDSSPDVDIKDDETEIEISPLLKTNIFREVLTLVCNLSSAMGSKNTQQEMVALRGRHPWAFQNLCLYSQVMELLGTFSYRLTIRRFIQFLFEGVDYTIIFETADRILGRITPS